MVEVSDSNFEEDVPLHSPIKAWTESLKEEEIVVTKYEEVQLQERQLTISSNNITIKLETKMLKGPPAAAHLSTVHVQTLVNCKLLLLVNNVNFNKIVLEWEASLLHFDER